MRSALRALVALLPLGWAAPAHTQEPAPPPAPALLTAGSARDSTGAMLAPGDLLRITVWRKPEFSGDFVVAPDSSVTHPLYRELKVAGVPLPAVEQRLHTFLARYETNPSFVMSPLLRVFVGGEVRQPNVYTVPPGTTIAQAIALAGGPTERGRLDRVHLQRGQQRDLLDLTQASSRITLMDIRSGDQLLVARRRNVFTDIVAPSASVLAAVAAVASIIIQTR